MTLASQGCPGQGASSRRRERLSSPKSALWSTVPLYTVPWSPTLLPLEKARRLSSLLERDLETLLTRVQSIEKKETFRYLPEIGITI
jgi:hypothetical protein